MLLGVQQRKKRVWRESIPHYILCGTVNRDEKIIMSRSFKVLIFVCKQKCHMQRVSRSVISLALLNSTHFELH